MNSLEYIGNTTHSVKGQFQEIWESGKLTSLKFAISSKIRLKINFGGTSCFKAKIHTKTKKKTIPYLLTKFSLHQAIIFSVQGKCCLFTPVI